MLLGHREFEAGFYWSCHLKTCMGQWQQPEVTRKDPGYPVVNLSNHPTQKFKKTWSNWPHGVSAGKLTVSKMLPPPRYDLPVVNADALARAVVAQHARARKDRPPLPLPRARRDC